MTRARVLIFSVAYLPFVGGAEVAVKEITDRLPNFAFDLITVNLSGRQKKFEKLGNVNVYRLGRGRLAKYFFPWTAFWLARKLQKKKRYQAVWAIMANYAGLAAVKFKRHFPEIPFLLTLQEGDDLAAVERKVRFIKSWWLDIFRRADCIQAISNYLAEWGRQMDATCPIEVVPNGVDLNRFQVSSFRNQEKRGKIIITTSRLVYKNGIDDLVKALQFLPSNVKLRILGVGPEEWKLRQLVRSLDLDSRVEFLGHTDHVQLPQYLATADIFVRPSRSEGLGNSFLEAMAAGLPTIGTPVGGIPDFLQDSVTGWFCEVNNPSSVAEKIKYILDPANFVQVEQVTKTARRLVEEKYSWTTITAQMEKIFVKIAENM